MKAKGKKITIPSSKHMCWHYVLHSTPIQDFAVFFFLFFYWRGDYGRMVRDTVFFTSKLEEGAMSQECRQYLKAGKDKEMESLLESPKRTQPVISVLDF